MKQLKSNKAVVIFTGRKRQGGRLLSYFIHQFLLSNTTLIVVLSFYVLFLEDQDYFTASDSEVNLVAAQNHTNSG